jgi:hypothetical protein
MAGGRRKITTALFFAYLAAHRHEKPRCHPAYFGRRIWSVFIGFAAPTLVVFSRQSVACLVFARDHGDN